MKWRLVVLVLFSGIFLAACGGSATAPTTRSSPTNLQSTTGSSATTSSPGSGPTILHVTRTDPSATNNIGPLDKTITDSVMVQQLYSSAQQAPAYATSTSISQSCLNDTGVIYHLDFLQGTSEIQRMNLDPGNCKILYLSQTDLRQASAAFLQMLTQALQVNSLTSN
ncbi:MAG TPA: hypothetical protein VGD98_12680 [Ktedonobacteraceae bacterium]